MSNSSLVEYTKLSPHKRSRNGNKISKITIHHAATVNASLEGLGRGFSGSRVASSNYGIDSNGKMVIPAIYHQVNQLDKNLFEVEFDYDYYDGHGAWMTIQL